MSEIPEDSNLTPENSYTKGKQNRTAIRHVVLKATRRLFLASFNCLGKDHSLQKLYLPKINVTRIESTANVRSEHGVYFLLSGTLLWYMFVCIYPSTLIIIHQNKGLFKICTKLKKKKKEEHILFKCAEMYSS